MRCCKKVPVVVPSAGFSHRRQRAPGCSPRLLGQSLLRLQVPLCKFSALDCSAGFGHTLPCSSPPKHQVPAAGNVPARGGAFGTQATLPTIPGSHRITGHSRRSRFAARLNSGVRPQCPPHTRPDTWLLELSECHHRLRLFPLPSPRKLALHSAAMQTQASTRLAIRSSQFCRTASRPSHLASQLLRQAFRLYSQRPNYSFKPSPLRGLGQNPPSSGGPA